MKIKQKIYSDMISLKQKLTKITSLIYICSMCLIFTKLQTILATIEIVNVLFEIQNESPTSK